MSTQWKYFDGNRIKAAINKSGPFADYLFTGNRGLEWPKGSGKTSIFTAGIWIAGIHRPTGQIRTAVQDYESEFQAGPIIGTFNTSTNDTTTLSNPSDGKYRVYKVHKADSDSAQDYRQWPGELGAPFLDLNGNGKWDEGVDKPKISGDQMLWSVYNDGYAAHHIPVAQTKPMGLEIHASYFGWDYGFLSDIMFIQWKIINKSDAYYDSVYFGIFHDADLGYANDDATGVDRVRELAYIYNADSSDDTVYGYASNPPACGIVLLESPHENTTGVDSAYFNGSWNYHYRNIHISSYTTLLTFDCGECISPIPMSNIVYNDLQGLKVDGLEYIDPHSHLSTKFVFSGDPVAKNGWYQTDSLSIGGSDVRGLLSSGPFTFAPNDTQEVVAAIIMAQGENYLKSLTKLRLVTDMTREYFYGGYKYAEDPQKPDEIKPLPHEYFLDQNFPNPFNPKTTITFAVPDLGYSYATQLKVFDILGRTVAVLVNGPIPAGTYSREWDATGLNSGVYYYSLSHGGMRQTKKMILVK